MKIKAILILLILSKFSLSQVSPVSRDLLFGVKTGLNFTRFSNQFYELDHGTKPLIGVFIESRVYNNVFMAGSVSYSLKGSNSASPFYKIENQYLEPELTFGLKLSKYLRLYSGVKLSLLRHSNLLILNGTSFSGYERIPITGYHSEVSIPIGISYFLYRNTSLNIDYCLPVISDAKSNFGLTFKIPVNSPNKAETYRQKRKIASANQINQLKNGTLIVRLKTSENKISVLKDMGKVEMAERVQKAQKEENMRIVHAFRTELDFCKVEFVFSNNSQNILDGNLEHIFLNDMLKVDSARQIDTANEILIAEFDSKSKDTVKYFSHVGHGYIENKGVRPIHRYYTSSMEFEGLALIILDKDFVQLNKPFPYFIPAEFKSIKKHPEHSFLLTPFFLYPNWYYNKTVREMNRRLHRFYNKVN
ncbi:MAG: hypothetical protein CVT94_01960 [Bacteroidetes bacterium HGW-Bacteroidetes-11]|nr:MAG: hypothetical protein CVT94_01960 [Bacteroidetes bacterium HGW-Bacteroidetes-11]